MHFSILVTAEIPETIQNPELDKEIKDDLKIMSIVKERHKGKKDIMLDMHIDYLKSIHNEFSRNVREEIYERMEPYGEQTDNLEYLVFEDMTDELRNRYENESVDCVKLPGGKIVAIHDSILRHKFCIHEDGKVYQRNFGQLKHDKRSKKAKKMIGYPNYPYKKLYKTYEEFAGEEMGYTYNEEENAYGYFYNPNAFYDWYQIGGRWPRVFLVKESCEEYCEGERSWGNRDSKFEAPEGYKWTVAARKKDIEWQAMKEWKIACETKYFHEYEEIYASKVVPNGYYCDIKGNKLVSWDNILYIEGETLEKHLLRKGLISNYKYPLDIYGYLDFEDYHEEYFCWRRGVTRKKYNKLKRQKDKLWRKDVERFVDELDDNTVLVGIDYHM